MKTVKKILLVTLSLCLVLGISACSQQTDPVPDETGNEGQEQTTPDTVESTGDPQNVKPVLLAVSFGTSYNESRDITIGAIEEALQAAYPDYEVRRAFTSQIIIDILAERESLEIDNVTEAMERLLSDGVKDVVVLPTHIMSGYEYDDVVAEVSAYADQFDSLKIGSPLLNTDDDYDAVIAALAEETADCNTDGTAIVLMGHGTEHAANATYATLQQKLTDAGCTNYFVGTVEAEPSLDEVLAAVQQTDANKVVLLPLMIVAGDHATNDMAGNEDDSWKTVFQNAEYEVECVLRGMGEYEGIQQLFVKHAEAAMEQDGLTAELAGNAVSAAQQPINADQIQDGTYEITVDSSSSMFNVVKCELTVENGAMSAVMTMSGQGYGMVFMGTGEQALAASEDQYIQAGQDADGAKTFTVPVEALNTDIDCAAWSINKEQWYDRVLVFRSDNIPADSLTLE